MYTSGFCGDNNSKQRVREHEEIHRHSILLRMDPKDTSQQHFGQAQETWALEQFALNWRKVPRAQR